MLTRVHYPSPFTRVERVLKVLFKHIFNTYSQLFGLWGSSRQFNSVLSSRTVLVEVNVVCDCYLSTRFFLLRVCEHCGRYLAKNTSLCCSSSTFFSFCDLSILFLYIKNLPSEFYFFSFLSCCPSLSSKFILLGILLFVEEAALKGKSYKNPGLRVNTEGN